MIRSRAGILFVVGWFLASRVLAADPVMYGDWGAGVGADNSFMYAATVNDSKEVFGEYCYFKTKSCNWYVQINSGCAAGVNTPVLANSDSGATALTITCIGPLKDHQYSSVFTDWKSLESEFKDSVHIGFAIPVGEDKFVVAHFSLNGRTNATQAMEAVFAEKAKVGQQGAQGTVDEQL